MNIVCRPISSWPWPETSPGARPRAPFRQNRRREWNGNWRDARPVPVGRTVSELKKELEHLQAQDVVLELDLREQDLRVDGWPKSDARTRSPRVVLSFHSDTPAPATTRPNRNTPGKAPFVVPHPRGLR
jgi:hypothetical protein